MANTPLSMVGSIKREYVYDLGERVAWTALQSFLATLVVSGWFSVQGATDLSILQKAGVAAVAAVLSLLKGLAASLVGSPNTAATLPLQDDTPESL